MSIQEEILDIADLLNNNDAVKRLRQIEIEMENDKEVIALASIFNMAQREYSDALKHYNEGSDELKKYLVSMHEAKYNLDVHPLVKKYYEALKEVNEPRRYLEMNLLSLFKDKSSSCK